MDEAIVAGQVAATGVNTSGFSLLWSVWPILLGAATLIVPTLLSLAQWSWSTEAGAHEPIVLVTGLWLIWRRADVLQVVQRAPLFPAAIVLALALAGYTVARITGILQLEFASLYAALVTLAWLELGRVALAKLWFPLVYLLFAIPPPENWLFIATRPLKTAISNTAVDVLSALGYAVGSSGTTIQVDGVELLIATACSGINSIIGICALGLLYTYLRRGDAPVYSILLVIILLPTAVMTNFVRILILVLITHYLGESAGQGVAHEATGMGMFLFSMLILIALDELLFPIAHRLGLAKMPGL